MRARPDDARQDHRRRPAGRRLRRPRRPDGASGARRAGLPGRDAFGQPAGDGGRARHAAAIDGTARLHPTRGPRRAAGGRHCRRTCAPAAIPAGWRASGRCGRSSSRRTRWRLDAARRERHARATRGSSTGCSPGVYLAPSQFEANFISAAHSEADIDATSPPQVRRSSCSVRVGTSRQSEARSQKGPLAIVRSQKKTRCTGGCSSGFWLLASGFWLLASGYWLLTWCQWKRRLRVQSIVRPHTRMKPAQSCSRDHRRIVGREGQRRHEHREAGPLPRCLGIGAKAAVGRHAAGDADAPGAGPAGRREGLVDERLDDRALEARAQVGKLLRARRPPLASARARGAARRSSAR